MAASLLTCAECTTQYALDLRACPHCGSSNFVEETGAVVLRLPLFVTVRCPECLRGPWTVRLSSVTSGLVDIPTLACASCGSRVPVPWPPEEEPMSPKITMHGGATNARATDPSPAVDASQPLLDGAEAVQEGHPTPDADDVVTGDGSGEVLPEISADAYGADAVPLDVADAGPDYDGMTLAELREEANRRDVPSYGTKAQIADRLREADAAAVE